MSHDYDPEIREEFGYPPEPEDMEFGLEQLEEPMTFSDATTGEELPFEFAYSLWVGEMAEPYLGTAAYETLPDVFEAVPGVQMVVQEDREVYYVSAKGDISMEDLEAALWQAFLKVAATTNT